MGPESAGTDNSGLAAPRRAPIGWRRASLVCHRPTAPDIVTVRTWSGLTRTRAERSPPRLLDLVLKRVAHELLFAGQVKLAQDVADVVLDRLFGDEQFGPNLPVGVAAGHQPEHLALAVGEGLHPG